MYLFWPKEKDLYLKKPNQNPMLLAITLLLIGFVILIKGADFLVNGSSSIAKKFNISNIAIGLTVVALGTSTPELLVSVTSSINGYNSAAFGNVIGSNNFNSLFILGVAGLIYPLIVQRNTIRFELPFSLIAVIVMFILVNDQLLWNSGINIFSRIDSLILLIVFGIFMIYIYRTMNNEPEGGAEGGEIKIYSNFKSIGFIALGLAMLVIGGKWVVDNAIFIARAHNLSDRLIGLTILAVGTSLPELATSAVAAYRRNTDIAIGNIVGSNIFNLLFILPITGMINPMEYSISINFDIYIFGAATIILMIFMFTLSTRKLDRLEAFILLVSYVAYSALLIWPEIN
jgi:cation:H+ antiporter